MEKKSDASVILRCIAYEGENAGKDGFYAVCLDLSLYTWRPNLQSAKASINQAISGYIEAVSLTEPDLCAENFAKCIKRPAPLRYWVLYYSAKYLNRKNNKPKSPKIFQRPIQQPALSAV